MASGFPDCCVISVKLMRRETAGLTLPGNSRRDTTPAGYSDQDTSFYEVACW